MLPNLNHGLDFSSQPFVLKSDEDDPMIPDKPIVPDLQTPGVNGIFAYPVSGKDFNSKLSLKQIVDGEHRAEGKYLCPIGGKVTGGGFILLPQEGLFSAGLKRYDNISVARTTDYSYLTLSVKSLSLLRLVAIGVC
ncbi:putative zinc finger protein [Fasciola gigantica]|uniref:Putative zinc finger protein n=1 Tax=Fasciola gigantica TaxID=46835 RepID=A0A504Z8G6_FASGI|nr:putative zinc finger protein [Fasciola gigantica]